MTETISPAGDVQLPDDAFDADQAEGLVTSVSPSRMAVRRFRRHKLAVVSLMVFLAIAMIVILAPITTRYGQIERLPAIGNKVGNSPPSWKAWFGTDDLNRDLYSRIIWGGRVSLLIGIAVAVVSSIVGTAVGAIAGLRGGFLDDALMRTTDLFLAFPTLVLLLVLRSMFSSLKWLKWLFGDLNSIRFIVVLLSILTWMGTARIVRGVVLSLKEREFVEASRALGASNSRIIVRHLIPNSIGPIIVSLTLAVVGAIVAESTLAFFGFGIDPVYATSWGGLLSDAKGAVIVGRWWLVVFPCAVFVLTILCVNFIGDGLRDAFDPKQDRSH